MNNEVFEINDEEERAIDDAPAQELCDDDDDVNDEECYSLFFRKRPGYLQVLCCWCAEYSRNYPLQMSHVHSHDPYKCGVCERFINPYEEDPLYGTLHEPILYPRGFHELGDWRDVERPIMENNRPEDYLVPRRHVDYEVPWESDSREEGEFGGKLEVEENPWPKV